MTSPAIDPTSDLQMQAVDESIRDRSRKAGFDHHFVKPFDPDLLWQLSGGDGATSSLGHVDQIMWAYREAIIVRD